MLVFNCFRLSCAIMIVGVLQLDNVLGNVDSVFEIPKWFTITWEVNTMSLSTMIETFENRYGKTTNKKPCPGDKNRLNQIESKRMAFFGNARQYLSLSYSKSSKNNDTKDNGYISLYLNLDFAQYVDSVRIDINVNCNELNINNKQLSNKKLSKDNLFEKKLVKKKFDNNNNTNNTNNNKSVCMIFKVDFKILKAIDKNKNGIAAMEWIMIMDSVENDMNLRQKFGNGKIPLSYFDKMLDDTDNKNGTYELGFMLPMFVIGNEISARIVITPINNATWWMRFSLIPLINELTKMDTESNIYCKELSLNFHQRLDYQLYLENNEKDNRLDKERLFNLISMMKDKYSKNDFDHSSFEFEVEIEMTLIEYNNNVKENINLTQWYENGGMVKTKTKNSDNVKNVKKWILLTELESSKDDTNLWIRSYMSHLADLNINDKDNRMYEENMQGIMCHLNIFDNDKDVECIDKYQVGFKEFRNAKKIPFVVKYKSREYIIMSHINETDNMIIHDRIYGICSIDKDNKLHLCEYYELRYNRNDNNGVALLSYYMTSSFQWYFCDNAFDTMNSTQATAQLNQFLFDIVKKVFESNEKKWNNSISIPEEWDIDQRMYVVSPDLLMVYPIFDIIYINRTKESELTQHFVVYRGRYNENNKNNDHLGHDYDCYFVPMYSGVYDTYVPNLWYDKLCQDIETFYKYVMDIDIRNEDQCDIDGVECADDSGTRKDRLLIEWKIGKPFIEKLKKKKLKQTFSSNTIGYTYDNDKHIEFNLNTHYWKQGKQYFFALQSSIFNKFIDIIDTSVILTIDEINYSKYVESMILNHIDSNNINKNFRTRFLTFGDLNLYDMLRNSIDRNNITSITIQCEIIINNIDINTNKMYFIDDNFESSQLQFKPFIYSFGISWHQLQTYIDDKQTMAPLALFAIDGDVILDNKLKEYINDIEFAITWEPMRYANDQLFEFMLLTHIDDNRYIEQIDIKTSLHIKELHFVGQWSTMTVQYNENGNAHGSRFANSKISQDLAQRLKLWLKQSSHDQLTLTVEYHIFLENIVINNHGKVN